MFSFLLGGNDGVQEVRELPHQTRITSYNVCYTKLLRLNGMFSKLFFKAATFAINIDSLLICRVF